VIISDASGRNNDNSDQHSDRRVEIVGAPAGMRFARTAVAAAEAASVGDGDGDNAIVAAVVSSSSSSSSRRR